MCGITGYISVDRSFSPESFMAANDLISYRGPDSYGYFALSYNGSQSFSHDSADTWSSTGSTDIQVALGFRRLSIIDISNSGSQPMCDNSGNTWLIFNGEIYNYLELKEQLVKLGHAFKSNSDSEVILYAYKEWGVECLQKFNGMWSFAIVDTKRRKVFCARDRFGIKPFNYYYDGKKFAFGSEVKQIKQLVAEVGEVDKSSVFDFLVFGAKNHTQYTFYRNVLELRGGEFLEIDYSNSSSLKLNKRKWWDLEYVPYEGSFDMAKDEFASLLEDSIKIRLRSDVPVGSALSGGLDSAGIVATIDKLTGSQQNTFTVSSKSDLYNELPLAEKVAQMYGTNAYSTEFGNQDISMLDIMTEHHDQPLSNPQNIGGWILYQDVKDKGITVNLNGQGADELMSGYSAPPHAINFLTNLQCGRPLIGSRELIKGIRNSEKSSIQNLTTLARESIKLMMGKQAYLQNAKTSRGLLNADFFETELSNSRFIESFAEHKKFSNLQKDTAYRQIKSTVIPGLLHNVDRDSSAHSLEARVPFLDYRLAQFAFNLPSHFLISNGFSKYIYRRAVEGKVPDEIVWNNRKLGFTMPYNTYYETGGEYLREQIASAHTLDCEIFNLDRIKKYSENWDYKNSAFYWRNMCTIIWLNQNSPS